MSHSVSITSIFPLSPRTLQKPPFERPHSILSQGGTTMYLISPTVRHSGCFLGFAITNNTVVSTLEHKSLSATPNVSSGSLPRGGIPGSKGLNIFQAHGTDGQTALQKDCPGFHSPQRLARGPTSLHTAATSDGLSFIFADL